MSTPDLPEVEVRSRAALRTWLAENHAKGQSVWLITFKKPSPDYLSVDDIVSELLAWGWVDSRTRMVDTDRTALLVAPRNPKNAWSAVNKRKVADLRAAGLMTAAGERMVEATKANGMWDFLDDVERLEVPADLAKALGGQRKTWDAWPRSVKRGTLEWIKTAKTAPTRARRIADVVNSAEAGLRPQPFRR